MQKIVLQGQKITNLPNQETLAKIYKEDEIKCRSQDLILQTL
ncbi:hypothetical protein [Rickettsia sp. TH2014]|nr:hypothetical protein [Rickettsia sp. TH2014]